MKKVIIVLSVLCVLTNTVYAQGFKIGAKAGVNLTKFTGASFTNEFKLAYQAGGFIELDFNKKIGIQPEVLFSQSYGQNVAFGSPINFSYSDIKLNYLSIPLLLRYRMGKIVVLNVGPQYSILLNSNDNLLVNGQNAFKNSEISIVTGLQLNFDFLRFYGRYSFGVENLNQTNSGNEWTNQQLQFGLGFRL